ncbi:MAG: DUF2730 family protein [Pseudomonadota bacterium]
MILDLKLLFDGVALLLSIAAIIYAFFANRRKDVDERFSEVSKRVDRHQERITQMEQVVAGQPGKDDFYQLRLTLAEMVGDIKAQTAKMDAMSESITRTENIVSRHEDHLRENG